MSDKQNGDSARPVPSACAASGLPLELCYDASHSAGRGEAAEIGRPGEYPYTRGVHPSMYRGRLWTMRQ
ncbi:MAG: hypothetical protein HY704_13800, partial [Gemmatimonadetes bacterium]|nr:hypothetical protein [Gemmatimonadota bacterium]